MSDLDLASLLERYAPEHGVPGAVLGVLRDGAIDVACHGVTDTTTGVSVAAQTRFAVGSLGKSMVATAVWRLAGDGRLRLDDPVAARVPELRAVGWAVASTIRDLLANRSRVPLSTETEFGVWPDAGDDVLSRVATRVASGVPTPPVWSYANAGWCLLGRAMETVTGQVWEQAMRTTLLDPLGLTETGYTTYTTGAGEEPRVAGHEVGAHGAVPVEPWVPRNLGPAGSTVLSTAADLLVFAQSHLRDPGLAGLRQTQADMRIPGWLDAWCLGWARFDWPGGPVWGWDGLTRGQRSILRLVPDRQTAVVLLTNGSSGRRLYRSIFPEIMAQVGIEMPALALTPSPGVAGDLSRFTGEYGWPDQRWTVTATGTGLLLDSPQGTLQARPLDSATFLVDPENPDTPTMTFGAFDDLGRPGALYDMVWALPWV